MLVIGNEILHGTTQDVNVHYLAQSLADWGIGLCEVRMVRDEEDVIKNALLFLSEHYDYVFTSGGIGPTHDDITTASVAAAFQKPLYCHPEALGALEEHAAAHSGTLNEVNKKMAYVPEGASLIENELSAAPGFQLHNVYVMAGVPIIFQAMLRAVLAEVAKKKKLLTEVLFVAAEESRIAVRLGQLQQDYPAVEIGSYPQLNKDGEYIVKIVLKSHEKENLRECVSALARYLKKKDLIKE